MSEDSIDDIEEVSNHCRIGKVSYKAHNLVQFPHTLRVSKERQEMIESVINMLDGAPEHFNGWIVMGWNKGGSSTYSRWDSGDIPYDCLPEYVKEKLRKCIELYEQSPSDEDDNEEESD